MDEAGEETIDLHPKVDNFCESHRPKSEIKATEPIQSRGDKGRVLFRYAYSMGISDNWVVMYRSPESGNMATISLPSLAGCRAT